MNRTKLPVPSSLIARVPDAAEKKRLIQDYQESSFILDVMKDAIEEELKFLLDKEEQETLFDEPGYIAHYAHLMGQRKMAKKILKLFPTKKKG